MTGREAIQAALEGTQKNLTWFLSDFTDADMLVRPVPGANHAAWQVGNVIGGDVVLIASELPAATYPALPPGFHDSHGSAGAKFDGPAGFLSHAEYMSLFAAVRAATIAALTTLTDADLDRPCTGKYKSFAPTLGKMFLAVSDHTTMHSGQFSVIRRKLGKPVLM